MSRKLSRRELASALAAAPALPAVVPGQAAKPDEDLLANARQQIARSAGQLSKYQLPASAEPAFVFKP